MPLPSLRAPARVDVQIGDALALLGDLPDSTFDSVVTDPPYAIRRLRRDVLSRPALKRPSCGDPACADALNICATCSRADLIGKYSEVSMLGQQSQNWHASETHSRGYADNDPTQFQQWCGIWMDECLRVLKPGGHLVAFGGTRTWHRLACAAEIAGFEIRDSMAWLYSSGMPKSQNVERAIRSRASTPDEHQAAKDWSGWGTTLKPAFEPIVLARRPLESTMVGNIRSWGVGPLNLNPHPSVDDASAGQSAKWPTNVALDGHQANLLGSRVGKDAADFFWVAKPTRAERVVVDGVVHPTVKPLDLLRRLVARVTPPGGLVLDPFAGSGTTVEACILDGFSVVAFERDPAYLPLIDARMDRTDALRAERRSAPADDALALF